MGCHCTSKFLGEEDVKLESLNNVINESIPSIRNLNYLLENNISDSPDTLNKELINTDQNINIENFDKDTKLETLRLSLFSEINLVRIKPENMINKIEKYMNNISKTENGNFYIKADEINNINLHKGKIIFEECKNYLKNKLPLNKLILKNELTFPFPENYSDVTQCVEEKYLTSTIKKIKENLKDFEIMNFHYDIMNFNTELSVVLQIVDDTNSMFQRRNNLFSKIAKYIGINIGKMTNGLYCYYLLFGKDKTILK
jgi:hypothetical protein